MIVIEKTLKSIIPYRLVFWPTEAILKELAENLPLTHYARVQCASIDLEGGRCIVRHNVALTLLIDLQRPIGAIYKDLIENARIRIHKAEKLGNRLAIRRYSGGPDRDRLMDKFVELYNEFARSKRPPKAPVSAADEYGYFPNAELVMAYLDGQPICGHLNLVDREVGIVRLQDSANRRFDDAATARLAGIVNVYLHWHELERYREEGLATYDFGSLGQVEDSVGVNRFKMQFGGRIIREHNYILAGTRLAAGTFYNVSSIFTRSGQQRRQVQDAGQRWRDMPLEQIRQTIEASIANYERNLQAQRGRENRT